VEAPLGVMASLEVRAARTRAARGSRPWWASRSSRPKGGTTSQRRSRKGARTITRSPPSVPVAIWGAVQKRGQVLSVM